MYMLKEIDIKDLKVGDYVFNDDKMLLVDFVQYGLSDRGIREVIRVDVKGYVDMSSIEFEILWLKDIKKAYRNDIHTNTEKNDVKGAKTIHSPSFGMDFLGKDKTEKTSSLQEFATDRSKGQDLKVVDRRIYKMIEVNRAKAIKSMSSIEKQAYAILFNLGIHKKKEFEGLAEAERVASDLGLKITRYYFKLVRDKKNHK